MKNRTWLVFANEKKCNHILSFEEQGFVSWVEARIKLALDDTVYVFVSSERRIRYKTKVVAVNCKREDSNYWIEPAPNDITSRLQLVEEYKGSELKEKDLELHGFKGGGSLQHPIYNKPELFAYINKCFDKE